MRIDCEKLDIELARNCKTLSDLRCVISPQTLTRVKKGIDVKPITAGKIAKALGVDPVDIIETEE